MRIEDIAPTRSLEYFIGTVHWLDALTPPLEAHLRRLVETVKTLLQIDPHSRASCRRASLQPLRFAARIPPMVGGHHRADVSGFQRDSDRNMRHCCCENVATAGRFASTGARAASGSTLRAASGLNCQASVDPACRHFRALRRYRRLRLAKFIIPSPRSGTYRLVTTQEEDGTDHAANGQYRTVGARTGRVRTGTYRVVGNAAIELEAPRKPPYSGRRTDHSDRSGRSCHARDLAGHDRTRRLLALTIQHNPDGTDHYQAQNEDTGSCAIADNQWRMTSAVTGKSNMGPIGRTRVQRRITGSTVPTLWQRQ